MKLENLENVGDSLTVLGRSYDTLMQYSKSSDAYGKSFGISFAKDKKGTEYFRLHFVDTPILGQVEGFKHLFLALDSKRFADQIDNFYRMIAEFKNDKYDHVKDEYIENLYTDLSLFGKPKNFYKLRMLVVTNKNKKRCYRLDVIKSGDKVYNEDVIESSYYLTNPDINRIYDYLNESLEDE